VISEQISLQRNVFIITKVEATSQSKKIVQAVEVACRMVLELAILEEELVEVRIRKLVVGLCDTQMEMAQDELVDYRALVEGSSFNTTKGQGRAGGRYHRVSLDSGECSSRLHTIV